MKPKKLAMIVGGILIVAILICIGGNMIASQAMLANGGMQTLMLTLTPQATPMEMAVRARGELVPERWTNLSFESNGQLAEWLVAEGTVVKAGAPLVRLDTTQLEFAVQQAEVELQSAELKLSEAQADHERELKDAQLALQSAQAHQGQIRARYPSLTEAEVELERARKAEADAATAYARAQDRPWEWISEDVRNVYTDKWNEAKQNLAIAQAQVDAQKGEQQAASREMAVIQTDVERARLDMAQLERGVDPLLEQDVEAKKIQLERARADLEAATLRAPFAGTVVKLHLRPGDWAQPGTTVVTLADLTTLRVETTDLDEWGATHVQVGDPAEITLTAFDDKQLAGRIAMIAVRGETTSSGDVVYKTVITLDQPDPELRWGMTVRITIPLEESK